MNRIEELIKITEGLTNLTHDHFVDSRKDDESKEGQIFYTSCAVLERLKGLQKALLE